MLLTLMLNLNMYQPYVPPPTLVGEYVVRARRRKGR